MSETSPPSTSTPTPVETTVKKTRRFVVEPVETTTRSNKKQDVQKIEDFSRLEKHEAPPQRRFIPQPLETTHKSSKTQMKSPPPPAEPKHIPIPQASPAEETPKPRRKFEPELIETTKRSKRAGDSRPATLPTDKTDLTPGVPNIYTKQKPRPSLRPIPPKNTPNGTPHPSSVHIPTTQISPLPPRRQQSMRPHLNTRRSTRQDSFQPELEAIPSEENSNTSEEDGGSNDGDSTPSLSGSFGSSDDSNMRLQLARTRESCDDRFSGYLLALAAKAAEKQLREQALAAFPNESFHEIVEHFYDREVEDTSDEGSVEGIGLLMDDARLSKKARRKSTEVGWAAKEMQEHQEKLNRLREDETNKKIAAEATKPTFKDPFWTNGMSVKAPADPQKEMELNRMRLAASPPMLGADLKFRMCPSPKATKFETDQKHDVQPKKCANGGGLWGGYCVAEEDGEYLTPTVRGPTLIQTPRSEREDPFSSACADELPDGSKSPKVNGHEGAGLKLIAGIDERLKAEVARSKQEEALLMEFDDTFVTQVYNYLSLGYPALARSYDEELGRISQISEEDLQADDMKQNAQGHIGIVDASGASPRSKGDGQPRCARWKALKVYILEWARQHPSMSGAAIPTAWGVRARRGSWAI